MGSASLTPSYNLSRYSPASGKGSRERGAPVSCESSGLIAGLFYAICEIPCFSGAAQRLIAYWLNSGDTILISNFDFGAYCAGAFGTPFKPIFRHRNDLTKVPPNRIQSMCRDAAQRARPVHELPSESLIKYGVPGISPEFRHVLKTSSCDLW